MHILACEKILKLHILTWEKILSLEYEEGNIHVKFKHIWYM